MGVTEFFYINYMKVLVIGTDGFIGSHFIIILLEQGFNVTDLSYYNSFNNWGWLYGINYSNLNVIPCDERPQFLKTLN